MLGSRPLLLVLQASFALPAAAGAQEANIHDHGIFSDLDATVRTKLPANTNPETIRLRVDPAHHLMVVYERDFPLKAYPFTAPLPKEGGILAPWLLDDLRTQDATELRALVSQRTAVQQYAGPWPDPTDADSDGLPNSLDILMGARKLVANQAAYTEGYISIAYPMGDVPRSVGVCSDTVVRAFRNAGFDLQVLVAKDIRAARSAYKNVKKPDTNIDHRRVANLLIWFSRHMREVSGAPLRPSDVVFLDTFPDRPGPEHVGIVSDRTAPSGLPYIINNWTVGYQEGEMDLLPSIPVTHRFRIN